MGSSTINQDMDALLDGIQNLQTDAEKFLSESGYKKVDGEHKKFQGADSQSTGLAVAQISFLDYITYTSLENWKQVVDNLEQFVANDIEAMEAADGV